NQLQRLDLLTAALAEPQREADLLGSREPLRMLLHAQLRFFFVGGLDIRFEPLSRTANGQWKECEAGQCKHPVGVRRAHLKHRGSVDAARVKVKSPPPENGGRRASLGDATTHAEPTLPRTRSTYAAAPCLPPMFLPLTSPAGQMPHRCWSGSREASSGRMSPWRHCWFCSKPAPS